MTDIRAALEALMARWDAEVRAMPDSRVRTVLQSCATEVRAILLDPVIARAALAAASPEPERCATCGQSRDGLKHRCWSTHFRRVREAGDGLHVTTDCHPFQSDLAAPTVEALREALLAWLGPCENYTWSDCRGNGRGPRDSKYGAERWCAPCEVRDRLDAIIAAARADERTRLAGTLPPFWRDDEDHP